MIPFLTSLRSLLSCHLLRGCFLATVYVGGKNNLFPFILCAGSVPVLPLCFIFFRALSSSNIAPISFSYVLTVSQLGHELHEGRHCCLFCLLLHPQGLEPY